MPIYTGAARKLDDIDLPKIGSEIGVGEDVIHALIEVETRGTGFDKQGRVLILFEPHRFYANLRGDKRTRAVEAGLAYPKWGMKKYPKDSYPRLEAAMEISETEALKSCSWGLGQIMGENHRMLGYASVQEMVAAFAEDEEAHLRGMIDFIKEAGIDDDLLRIQRKIDKGQKVTAVDWIPVVRVYNGSGYAKNNYHNRAAAALNKWLKIKDTPFGKNINIIERAALEELENAVEDVTEVEEVALPEQPSAPPVDTEKSQVTAPPGQASNDSEKIPAIPPLPVNLPPWVKRIVTWGAGLNIAGFSGALGLLEDPVKLSAVLNILKWTAAGVLGAGIVIGLAVLIMKMWNAKLANDLNIARLNNFADKNTVNVDFKGWKDTSPDVVSNDSNLK